MSEITLTAEWADLDWICYWAGQYVEEKQFTDHDESKQRIARVRMAMEFAKINPETVLDKSLRKE